MRNGQSIDLVDASIQFESTQSYLHSLMPVSEPWHHIGQHWRDMFDTGHKQHNNKCLQVTEIWVPGTRHTELQDRNFKRAPHFRLKWRRKVPCLRQKYVKGTESQNVPKSSKWWWRFFHASPRRLETNIVRRGPTNIELVELKHRPIGEILSDQRW